ncbi:MAG: stage II sporulation protein M [Nanobdellota archaeon]
MSFEILFRPKELLKNPVKLFILSLIVVSIGVLLSFRIFPASSSILIVTFTVIPLIPIITRMMEDEEKVFIKEKMSRIFKHKVIKMYFLLFIFLSISFSLWFVAMPEQKSMDLFGEQLKSLELGGNEESFGLEGCTDAYFSNRISEYETCKVVDFDDDMVEEYVIETEERKVIYSVKEDNFRPYNQWMFSHITSNNLTILLFIFLTSFALGAGAIFTIAWNASILGVFIGEAMHRSIGIIANVKGYLSALSSSLLAIFVHGIFEITGFITAALAGGILSVAVIKKVKGIDMNKRHLKTIIIDTSILLISSVALIIIAALLEVHL